MQNNNNNNNNENVNNNNNNINAFNLVCIPFFPEEIAFIKNSIENYNASIPNSQPIGYEASICKKLVQITINEDSPTKWMFYKTNALLSTVGNNDDNNPDTVLNVVINKMFPNFQKRVCSIEKITHVSNFMDHFEIIKIYVYNLLNTMMLTKLEYEYKINNLMVLKYIGNDDLLDLYIGTNKIHFYRFNTYIEISNAIKEIIKLLFDSITIDTEDKIYIMSCNILWMKCMTQTSGVTNLKNWRYIRNINEPMINARTFEYNSQNEINNLNIFVELNFDSNKLVLKCINQGISYYVTQPMTIKNHKILSNANNEINYCVRVEKCLEHEFHEMSNNFIKFILYNKNLNNKKNTESIGISESSGYIDSFNSTNINFIKLTYDQMMNKMIYFEQ